MTKRNLAITMAFCLIFFGFVVFLKNKKQQIASSKITPTSTTPIQKPLILNGRRVLGMHPSTTAGQLKTLKTANTISTKWEPILEQNIRAQGGDAVKSIKIKKVDSFIWNQDGLALNVESVMVSIKNQRGEETSFKALVDSQNGKILQNWDRPVFDPIHPKDNFKVRIDPRYHNE
jgi:hypothetical protein